AIDKQYRPGPNPARWKGRVQNAFGMIETREKRNHPSLPYSEMPEFWQWLIAKRSTTSLALQLLILTATRANEAAEALWPEINFDTQLWTIPKARMKA